MTTATQGTLFSTVGPTYCPECGLHDGRHHFTCSSLRPRAHARRTDPETSHEAAGSLTAERLRASQQAVLDLLKRCGPATDEEVASLYLQARSIFPEWPEQSPSGLRTRRAELVDLGLVRDSGGRERLESGRYAVVWEVVW